MTRRPEPHLPDPGRYPEQVSFDWFLLVVLTICAAVVVFVAIKVMLSIQVGHDCSNKGGTYVDGKCLDVKEIH